MTVFRDPGEGEAPQTIVPTLPRIHAMRRQAEHFVAFAAGRRGPTCGAAEALEDLKIARDYIRLLDAQRSGECH